MSDELGDRIANNLGKVFMEAAKKMQEERIHKQWTKDEFSDEDQIGYFFDRDYSGGASVTLDHDGSLVFEGYNHSVVIENIGTKNERVIIKNAADLVI